MTRSRHTCHAKGCPREVPPKMLMCRKHWYMVPQGIRDRVWATYRPGQENTKDPSPEYLEAALAAVKAVSDKEATTA